MESAKNCFRESINSEFLQFLALLLQYFYYKNILEMKIWLQLGSYFRKYISRFRKVSLEEDFEITDFDLTPYIDCYLEHESHHT